jgi:thiamine biosynthesis lipoprotein
MRKKFFVFITILILILTASSCSKKEEIISNRTFALDTLVEIKLYQYEGGSLDDSINAGAFELIRSLEDTLSVHVEGSDIYNLKENAGIKPTQVSDIAYKVIKDSLMYSELTGGLFDVTAGPLIDLWAIDPPYGHVPTQQELDTVLPLIDYRGIEFLQDDTIELKKEGMIVNLGAIAKGTIADEVKDYLIDSGVENAMINLGGNILLVGSKLGGNDFVIGIQDPNDDRGRYLLAVHINDEALVSSGDYERYFEQDGRIYHHILNPETGYPADTNIKQVTIIAPESEMADGLSTSVLLLGLKDGIALVESLDDVEAIFITKDNKIYTTDGLDGRYEIDDSLSENYTLVDDPQDLY